MDDLDAFLKSTDDLPNEIDETTTKLSADECKKLGNEAFAKGDNESAIKHYSAGIEVDPKNYVLFSNRSAAKLKLGKLEEALADANECVKLNQVWGKAYGRRGAALMKLNRIEEALEAYTEGLTVDKQNYTLVQGKKQCEELLANTGDTTTKKKQAEEKKRLNEEKEFEEYLKEVEKLDPNQVPKELKKTAIDHDIETKGWTNQNQLDRILCPNYKWINLNPFTTFAMSHNANAEDIKKRYRKLSSMVHPDKNRDPRAKEAFDQLKKAHELLKSDAKRKLVIRCIEKCTKNVIVTRNRLKKKGLSEQELIQRDGSLEHAIDIAVKKEFAEQERRRLVSESRKRTYQQREQDQEMEQQEYWKNIQKQEEKFREGREGRAKSWQGFAKKGGKYGTKPPPLKKEGNHKRSKTMGVDESYKKNWR